MWGREVSLLEIHVVVHKRGGRLPGAGFPACHVFPSFSVYKKFRALIQVEVSPTVGKGNL